MKEIKNATDAVYRHLVIQGSITSKEAFDSYGCTRLASVIHRLREAGSSIETIMQSGKNRYGKACHYARYVLAHEERVMEWAKLTAPEESVDE